MTRRRTASEGIGILESSHAIQILIFLLDHDGCRKLELYEGVTRTNFISRKIDDLEYAGLIEQHIDGRATRIFLTSSGRIAAAKLREVRDVIDAAGAGPSRTIDGATEAAGAEQPTVGIQDRDQSVILIP